ncbi:MAG: flavoprotein, partial [Candidatus Dormibacterales bacterium]
MGEAEVPREVRGLRVAVLVSGGIAAYKVADLVSRLVQAGCPVRVAMTPAAREFVGPSTFSGLTGRPVEDDLFAAGSAGEPHVALGDWAQLMLAAPATADLIARTAAGAASDTVAAAMLAARCPLVVAPAMNDAMWEKAPVAANLELLQQRGVIVVEPEAGRLASGHSGTGRLAAPEALLAGLAQAARSRYDLAGRRVLVTAGGTREPIDPVRFI